MKKMMILLFALVFLLFLEGCQFSGESIKVEIERTTISCCKIGDNIYDSVSSNFQCNRAGGIAVSCPNICCTSRGRILGAASQAECIRSFAGKPRICPKFAVLK